VPNPWDISSIRKSVFYDMYRIGTLISFGLVWLVTSLLLKNYTKMHQKRIGWWKFWLLASLPSLYYVFPIDLITNNLVTGILEYPFLRILIIYVSVVIYVSVATRQVGGFFFALSFFFMARSVENIDLKNYLILSGVDKELLLKLGKHISMQPDSFLSGIGSAEWSQNVQTTVNQVMGYKADPHEAQHVSLDFSQIQHWSQNLSSKMTEANLNPASRLSTIDRLPQLSSYHKNEKFKEMTNEDTFSYLHSIRRTETKDPLHR
jgi:hypothetical protein